MKKRKIQLSVNIMAVFCAAVMISCGGDSGSGPDATGPSISSSAPAADDIDVAVTSTVTIVFNEIIDSEKFDSGCITVAAGTTAAAGSSVLSSDGRTVVFTPTSNFDYSTVYTVSLAESSIEDLSGNGLAAKQGFSFTTTAEKNSWTIMYYGDADCNLEGALLEDVEEMKNGIVDCQGITLVTLFDRSPYSSSGDGYSSNSTTFGENFTDTRMYRVTHGKATRISGGTKFPEITTTSAYEADMGDAATLNKFVESCKEQYPADHYALILSNHGGGCKSVMRASSDSMKSSSSSKSICWDETSNDDFLYTAEISAALDSSDSVDLLGFDACLMSSAELAYQFKPGNGGFSADYMVACPPTETGNGWEFEKILSRINLKRGDNGETDQTVGDKELNYDPSAMTAANLGAIIVEEQRDSTMTDSSQALTCLDLSKAAAVKTAVDSLAVSLAPYKTQMAELRGSGTEVNILHYFDETMTYQYSNSDTFYYDWLYYPFFDLYALSSAINSSSSFTAVQSEAAAVMTAVDAMVLYSFANSDFSGFTEGKNGVHIVFPDGAAAFTSDGVTYTYWSQQYWYNAVKLYKKSGAFAGGGLAWCADGATEGNGTVDNWFELLDSWYDSSNGSEGGVNYYQY